MGSKITAEKFYKASQYGGIQTTSEPVELPR